MSSLLLIGFIVAVLACAVLLSLLYVQLFAEAVAISQLEAANKVLEIRGRHKAVYKHK
jgi:hypothetical protein